MGVVGWGEVGDAGLDRFVLGAEADSATRLCKEPGSCRHSDKGTLITRNRRFSNTADTDPSGNLSEWILDGCCHNLASHVLESNAFEIIITAAVLWLGIGVLFIRKDNNRKVI